MKLIFGKYEDIPQRDKMPQYNTRRTSTSMLHLSPVDELRRVTQDYTRYPGQVSDPAKGIYGAGAHSDFGFLTLLATDNVSGLQICKDKDVKPQVWEDVEPLKGAFVVNLGDMLERWSNCIFRT
nr:2-oxoglutarate-Fe(II) type oxidoreductase-like isoform X2 [Tanacetum cinerariifolium]